MDWKFYYNNLRKSQKTHTTQQYCLEFLQLTQYDGNLLSYEEINQLLSEMPPVENTNFSLFPFSNNCKKIIDDGNYYLLAQIFFHLPHIDLTWMNYNNPIDYDCENFYSKLLGNSKESFFYLNNISTTNILKNKGDKYILTFLFLLCLPCCEKDTHLWDLNHNHVCSIPFINEVNYEMILEISYDTNPTVFESLCKRENNLSIKLLENFMDIQTDLLDFKHIDWDIHIPIYQLYQLAEYDCYAYNISKLVSNRYTILYPNLLSCVERLNIDIFKDILQDQIPFQNIRCNENIIKRKIVKF